MARSRDDDDDERISNNPRAGNRRDDDEDPPPRRRRRDEDDEDDDGPRGRRVSRGPMGPLDGMFRDTNIVVLILFAVCCNGIAFILSLIAFLTAKDEKAKSNATVCLIISVILTVLGVGLQLASLAMQK